MRAASQAESGDPTLTSVARRGRQHGDVGEEQRRRRATRSGRTGAARRRWPARARSGWRGARRRPAAAAVRRAGLALGRDQDGDRPAFDEGHEQRSAEQHQQHREQERRQRDRMREQRGGDGRDRAAHALADDVFRRQARGEQDQHRPAGDGHGQQRREDGVGDELHDHDLPVRRCDQGAALQRQFRRRRCAPCADGPGHYTTRISPRLALVPAWIAPATMSRSQRMICPPAVRRGLLRVAAGTAGADRAHGAGRACLVARSTLGWSAG